MPPSVYANFLRVASQDSEFFLAFGQVSPGGQPGAHALACLVTTPRHAKAMLDALRKAVEAHEERFGPIPAPAQEPPAAAAR